MRNIFLLYIPPANHEAMVHYEDTIRRTVSPERIYRYVDQNLRRQIDSIFGGRPIAVWGSRDSGANRAKFQRMVPGDEILIIEGDTIKLLGKIAETTISPDLSRELWQNLRGRVTCAEHNLIKVARSWLVADGYWWSILMKIRAYVLIEGRVQGVFFRAETRTVARQHNLTGWVKNLYDGKRGSSL